MMRPLLLSLLSLLLPAPGVHALPAAGEELEQLAKDLRSANGRSDAEARADVLEAIIALGEEEGLDVIRGSFASASGRLRGGRRDELEGRYMLERKLVVLANLRARAESNAAARRSLPELEQEVDELRNKLERSTSTMGREQECIDALGAAAQRLFDAFGVRKRKKLEERLWSVAEEPLEGDLDSNQRLGAVELLGRVGGPGTAVKLQELIVEVEKVRIRLRRDLPKLELEVEKYEERMQREQDQSGGRHSLSTQEQYERAQAEAQAVYRAARSMSFVSEAAEEGGALALRREGSDTLEKSIKTLLRAQRKARDGVRGRTLALIAKAGTPMVLRELRELLAGEREPLGRADIIDGLAHAGDLELVPALVDVYLADESWHVRARAAAALQRLRDVAGIPALIGRLEVEEGRVRTDIVLALRSLTGERFSGKAEIWRRWWGDQGPGFEVPPLEPSPVSFEDRPEDVSFSFFGIPTDSERVLFVLDVSGSMNEAMLLAAGGGEEQTRLEAAKEELVRALRMVGDGGVFNILLFASSKRTWKDGLALMDEDSREEAIAYVDGLQAVGATNTYGALKLALDLAGAVAGDAWSDPEIDTIFLLTDGQASIGVTTASNEILDYVAERNHAAGIVIHTIGISQSQDAYFLRSLAEQNGGTYVAR